MGFCKFSLSGMMPAEAARAKVEDSWTLYSHFSAKQGIFGVLEVPKWL